MKFLLIIVLALFSGGSGVAQWLGGPSSGMAHAGATTRDAWSVFYNVGGLPWIQRSQLVAAYENRFGFSEGLHAAGVGFVHPLSSSTIGLSVYRFGDALYSEDQVALAFGQRIGQFSFGLRLSGHQYHTETVGTRFASTVDIGGVARLSPTLFFGMQITNLTQSRKSRITPERIPTRVQTGLEYKPNNSFRLLTEVEHEVQRSTQVKVGAEYTVLKKVSLRCGVRTPGFQQFFGLGLRHRLLHVDYALITHPALGWSHQLSLTYQPSH